MIAIIETVAKGVVIEAEAAIKAAIIEAIVVTKVIVTEAVAVPETNGLLPLSSA
ncbi:hypothetical protein ACFO4N_02155 [Camelliibacillus cellulosilyticus]|uniref:Uncharacterized protein n=1 Tax=Camelliibacillus cellulosilyticus TaxID=2174486 RepID=A0ABV9GLH7_9BACL